MISRLSAGVAMLGCLGACWRAGTAESKPSLPVTVESFSAVFQPEERGELRLGLWANDLGPANGVASAIDWEVWFNGRRFAEGMQALEQPLQNGENRVLVVIPLMLRKRQRLRGPVDIQVAIRGRLRIDHGKHQEWLPFERQLKTTSSHLPVIADEDEG